jgi:hypothetical protein
LNKRTETHLQRLQSLQSNIRNMMDVVMGKKDWNTGASKTGEVTVPEAAPLDPSNLNFILGQLGNTEAVAEASKIINQKALDKAKKAEADWLKDKQKARLEYWELVAKDEEEANKLTSKRLIEKWEEEEKWRQDSLKATGDYWESLAKEQADADKEEVKRLLAKWDDEKNAPQKAADEAAKMVTFYKDMKGMEDEYRQAKLDWVQKEAAVKFKGMDQEVLKARWVKEQTIKFEQEIFDAKAQQIQAGLGDMASMFQSLAGMYDKNSSEAARMQEAANAMIVLQKAVAAVNAVSAVAAAAAAPFPAGFVAMASMAAAMGSLLGSIGVSFGGGSGASAPSAAYGQNTTVLGGANNQGSESIGNTWKLLEDTYDLQKHTLTGIYENMKELNANITGIVKGIIQGDIGSAVAGSSGAGSLFKLGAAGGVGGLMAGGAASYFIGGMISMGALGPAAIGAAAMMVLDKYLLGGRVGDYLLGGGVTPTGSGISIRGGGTEAYSYQRTTTAGGMLGGDSEQYILGALNQDLSNLLSGPNGIFTNVKKSITEISKIIGGDITLLNKIIPDLEINLAGLDAEGIQKKLSEVFSSIGDNFAKDVFGSLIPLYQKVGEGAFETVSRLAIDLMTVTNILSMTGKSATTNTIALSESLIELAGGLDKLQSAADAYFDKFYTATEKQIYLQGQITDVMTELGYDTLPQTREQFRAIVEALDLTTTFGQETYVALMQLSPAMDEFISALEDALDVALSSATSALDEYQSAINKSADDWRSLADAFRSVRQTIRDLIDELTGVGESPWATTGILKGRMESTYQTAMTGNKDALEKFPADVKAYLNASMASSRTLGEYNLERARVINMLSETEKVATVAINWAEYQAGVLDDMSSILDKIREELEKGVTANLTLIEGWMAKLATKETQLGWDKFILTPFTTALDDTTTVVKNLYFSLGKDGLAGTADDLYIAFGPDGLLGTSDDLIMAFGRDGLMGTLDDVNFSLGPDGLRGTADDLYLLLGPDGLAGTADDLIMAFGPDGLRGTIDDAIFSYTIAAEAAKSLYFSLGKDGLAGTADDLYIAFGEDGLLGTMDDVIMAFGRDGLMGTLDDVNFSLGLDGLKGTADDLYLSLGPDGLAGTTDDLIMAFGPDGLRGTVDDAIFSYMKVAEAANNLYLSLGPDGLKGTADDLYIAFGPDGVLGTVDDMIMAFGPDGLMGTSDDIVASLAAMGGEIGKVILSLGPDGLKGTADDLYLSFGPDGLLGTADDLIASFGPDGLMGTLDDVISDLTLFDWSKQIDPVAWDLFISTVDWEKFVNSLAWETFVGSVAWNDFVESLAWNDFIGSLGWDAFIESISWTTFINSLSWDTFVGSLSWDKFMTTLSWKTFMTSLSWDKFMSTLSWNTFVTSLAWTSFVDNMGWSNYVPGMRWSDYISSVSWANFIPGITWSDYIGKIDWSPVTNGAAGLAYYLNNLNAPTGSLVTLPTLFGSLSTSITGLVNTINSIKISAPVVTPTPTPTPVVTAAVGTDAYNQQLMMANPRNYIEYFKACARQTAPGLGFSPQQAMAILNSIGVFTWANGGAFSMGNIIPFANGGIYDSPTLFPMANGMGLMGEAGPEAIMPLSRGSDGKLGVRSGGDNVVLIAEIRALREEMKVNLYSIAKNTGKMSKVIDRFDQDGLPPDRDGIISKWDTVGLPATRP